MARSRRAVPVRHCGAATATLRRAGRKSGRGDRLGGARGGARARARRGAGGRRLAAARAARRRGGRRGKRRARAQARGGRRPGPVLKTAGAGGSRGRVGGGGDGGREGARARGGRGDLLSHNPAFGRGGGGAAGRSARAAGGGGAGSCSRRRSGARARARLAGAAISAAPCKASSSRSADHESGESGRRFPMTGGCSCGVIRYEIASFPLLALHLQLHGLPDPQRQRVRSQYAGDGQGFSHSARASRKAWHYTSPTGVPVTSWFCGDCGARIYGERAGPRRNRQRPRRNARRHLVAGAGGAFLHPRHQRPVVGPAGGRGQLFRNPAGRFGANDAAGMAGAVARILSRKIVPVLRNRLMPWQFSPG